VKTFLIAVVCFVASFAGAYLYLQENAPRGAEAEIAEDLKDAIVAELGNPPEPARDEAAAPSVRESYRTLQASFRTMNQTCSAESRKAYALAFSNLMEATEAANAARAGFGVDIDQMGTLNQFFDAVARGVVRPTDISSRKLRRMVAATARGGPSIGAISLIGDEGEPVEAVRCKPLPEEEG
jgi:hypothetical protein